MAEVERVILVPVRLIRNLAGWIDSLEVQGALLGAYQRGQRVGPDFSNSAQRMWDEVRELAKEKAG